MGSSLGLEQASGPCLWVRRESAARISRLQLQSFPPFFFIVVRLSSLSLSHPVSLYLRLFSLFIGFASFLSLYLYLSISLCLSVCLLLSSSAFIFNGSRVVSLSYFWAFGVVTSFSFHRHFHRLTTVFHHLTHGDSSCTAHSYPALPLLYHTAFLFMFCFIICVLHSISVSVLSSALHLSLLFSSIVFPSFAVVLYSTS